MLVVSHQPGSLYNVLARFNALGIQLQKLEKPSDSAKRLRLYVLL